MGSIRYRSCSIEGTRANAVLTFREAVADAVAAVQDELARLNDLTSQRLDEAVVLVGRVDSTLVKEPLRNPNTLVVRSKPENQGQTYRLAPKIDTKTPITGAPDDRPFGRGGLVDTVETSMGQWLMQRTDGSVYGATENLTDASFFGKNATLVGSAPGTQDGGPLGPSRSFDGSAYFQIKTGTAIMDVSESLMLLRGDMGVWAWVKPQDGQERCVVSFSSAPTEPGSRVPVSTGSPQTTAALTYGATLVGVSSATDLQKLNRVTFSSQPDRQYEISDITGLVLTLSEPYRGPTAAGVTITKTYDPVLGVVLPPENRNTIYGLSVERSTNTVRAYWEHHNRQVAEAVNTNVFLPAGEHFFCGFQRRMRVLQGTVSVSTTNNPPFAPIVTVTGIGTNFTTEFGTGDVTEKYFRFDGDQTFYRILHVANDTTLNIDISLEPTSVFPPYTGVAYSSLRTLVHVGKLDGTFSTHVTDHLAGPTGGLEPDTSVRFNRPAMANFYIGRDAEFPSKGFLGAMNVVSFYQKPPDASDVDLDAKMRFMFGRAFPDYIASKSLIRRNVVSDITDGQTVYCDYRYKSSLATAKATTDVVTGHVDDMIVGLENPNVKTTSQLAQTIKAPDPAKQDDIDHLNRLMPRYGMLVANGQPLIRGTTDMSAYNALVKTVGSVIEADKLVLNKPEKSFVLVAITEDYSEVATVDSCGRPSTTLVITERIVGVNKNLREAAMAAGFSNADSLKLKLWWIGSVGIGDYNIQKMRLLGMTGSQIADAMAVTSTDRMSVFVIPVPDVAQKLRDAGMLGDDVEAIANRPENTTDLPAAAPGIIPINTSPGVGDVAAAVQRAITAPAGTTVDGDQSPLNPALVTARTVDLGKALQARVDDLFPAAILDAADKDCQALIAIVDDMLGNLTRTLKRVSDVVVPFALHESASIGTQKLAFDKYIPCVANVSANFALPPFHIKIDLVISLLKHLLEQGTSVVRQTETVVERFNTLLCIPKTLIAAIRGGVCGIEQPKVVANRRCPPQLDMLLDRLQALVDTIELLLRRILQALTSFAVDVELTGGSASRLAVDASLPCIGPVANFMLALG